LTTETEAIHSSGACEKFSQEFLAKVGGLQEAKARQALTILRLLMAGLIGSEVADALKLKNRQNAYWWIDKFEKFGWIYCTSPENSRSSGKRYRLTNACQKFLTASDRELLEAALASRNRVDNVRFEAVLLSEDCGGWELLKSKLTRKDGMRNWDRWASKTGEFDGWTIEAHEGNERRIMVIAGKRYGERNGEDLLSRVQTDAECFVRQLGERFGLKFAPLMKVHGTAEYLLGSNSVFRVLAARNSLLENDVAKEDHSHPNRKRGEGEAKDAEVFDAFTHLPQILLRDVELREQTDAKVSELAGRVDGVVGAVEKQAAVVSEFAKQISLHLAVMRQIDTNAKAQTEATQRLTEAIDCFTATHEKRNRQRSENSGSREPP